MNVCSVSNKFARTSKIVASGIDVLRSKCVNVLLFDEGIHRSSDRSLNNFTKSRRT
jgi:hypothetical protein